MLNQIYTCNYVFSFYSHLRGFHWYIIFLLVPVEREERVKRSSIVNGFTQAVMIVQLGIHQDRGEREREREVKRKSNAQYISIT